MKRGEILLALPQGEPILTDNDTSPIDTGNFSNYILHITPERNYPDFGTTISTPYLAPALQYVSDLEHNVFLMEENERMELLAEELPHYGPFMQKILGIDLEEEKQKIADEQAPGERFSLISYDYRNGLWVPETPVLGTYDKVTSSYSYFVEPREFRLPTTEVHTHPDDSPFSPTDYMRLITGYEDGFRMFRNIIVICPDIQVMAVATKQTPMYPGLEAFQKTTEWSDELHNVQHQSLAELDAVTEQMDAEAQEYIDRILEDAADYVMELEEKQNSEQLSNEACAEDLRAYLRRLHPSLTEDRDALRRRQHAAREAYNKESYLVTSNYLIGLARNLQIRLYYSSNMTDWTAFSA